MPSHVVSALALLAAGAACARGTGDVAHQATAGEPPDSVYVEVVNDHFYDARVHAVYDGGARHSLGTIPGNGNHAELVIPWQPRPLVFEITFVISNAAYLTYPIDVARGEALEIRLPSNIHLSGFFRRVPKR